MPRDPLPFDPRVEVFEANPRNPGAVISVALSPGGNPRRVTAAQARELVARLLAAIELAESGRPLPAVPKRP